MIFQHTWQRVLDGTKTQTRRRAKSNELLSESHSSISVWVPDTPRSKGHYRFVYQIGRTYAVQPARGKKAVARIRITDIRLEDVREISDEDVLAEGFASWADFLGLWCNMHDKQSGHEYDQAVHGAWRDYLRTRPDERYQAWALTFELA